MLLIMTSRVRNWYNMFSCVVYTWTMFCNLFCVCIIVNVRPPTKTNTTLAMKFKSALCSGCLITKQTLMLKNDEQTCFYLNDVTDMLGVQTIS